MFNVFVSCPRALEYLLADEVVGLGIKVEKISPQGVYILAELVDIYKICLWSRIANRVQVILYKGEVNHNDMLYNLTYNYNWLANFSEHNTFAIKFHGTSSRIQNSMYGALLIKDAIVDYFVTNTQQRPNIAKDNPDILIHAHLQHDKITVSLDMTGYSLHQRGYRARNYEAPLKENIAAAMLYRSKWPELSAANYQLYDPFCGTGTIVIEAAMMALNIAPGLLRNDQALRNWKKHDDKLWLATQAEARAAINKSQKLQIFASDISPKAIEIAKESAKLAQVFTMINFKQLDFADYKQPQLDKGLLIANPPFGERLGSLEKLKPLYKIIGEKIYNYFPTWNAAILTYDPTLAKAIEIRSNKQYKLYNGPLECKLYCFTTKPLQKLVYATTCIKNLANPHNLPILEETNAGSKPIARSLANASQQNIMFTNRLSKNYQHLRKWAKKNNISCYRVYDADLPEYAFAIDIYADNCVIQEYKAPSSVPEEKAKQRLEDVYHLTPEVLEINKRNVIVKTRAKQKGKQQYTKIANTKNYIEVNEGRAKFKINLTDYLDTGLFLDHRIMRLEFAKLAPKTKFLNCYCYTATASVHAAISGALTTNLDLSNTYLSWAKDNFLLNSLDISKHRFIQTDCLNWLKNCKEKFEVIFLDPPSFSNSKSMESTLDIQRDHFELIDHALKLLSANGTLYFSTNLRKFKLDPEITSKYNVEDISLKTIDKDFKRNFKIHYCFKIWLKNFRS